MSIIIRTLSGLALTVCLIAGASAQEESPIDQLHWVEGPDTVELADRAKIELPAGFLSLDAGDTATLMELMENPTSTEEFFFGPDDMRWWVVFSYEDTGHIEDDEAIDADDVLASIREGNEYANEERRERGWGELEIVGWKYSPFYEPDTNRLAWAVLARSEEGEVVNYNTRLLGRTGVMSATLVADPETLDVAVAEFKDSLRGFEYSEGNRYAEFRPGDKVAAYGLAALVAGGAAAAVAKTGASKGLFKIVGAAVIAGIAALSGFVKRLTGKGKSA